MDKNDSFDEVIVFEVMTAELETSWWKEYRQKLEMNFQQEDVLMRAINVTRLTVGTAHRCDVSLKKSLKPHLEPVGGAHL